MKKWALFSAVVFGVLAVTAGATPDGMTAPPPPSGIASFVVPPTQERTVVFTDRGRTYMVGLSTSRVAFFDGSTPVPPPYNPPAPTLTGLSKQVYESINASPITPQNRKLGAAALSGAIDTTLAQVGGLNLTDPQQIVNTLANNAEAAQVNQLLAGWKLGDLLAGANVTTKESLIKALEDIKAGLEAIK